MTLFLTRRAIRSALTLLLVFTAVFFATRMSGDPLSWVLPDGGSVEAEQAMRTYLGLDKSVAEQYLRYFHGFFEGQFGISFFERRAVGEMFSERLPATLGLAGLAFLLSITVGIPIGIFAALHRGKPLDHFLMSLSFIGYSLPNFVLGITLILIFSFFLNWLPSSGQGGWRHYLMPVITMGLPSAAGIARLTRSAMLDVILKDYLRTARAKGIAERMVIGKHALRNACIPVVTILGLQLGTLIAGSVIVETIFAWPGIGSLLVNSVMRRDYPVLQFGILIVAMTVVLANLIVDICYSLLDPRIRVEA